MLVFRFDAPDDENVTPLEGISGPGDSGGPALIETTDGLRLAGLSVASSGRPKGRYGTWEFYARVSPQLAWIRDVTSTAGMDEPIVTPGSVTTDKVQFIVKPVAVPSGDVESVVSPGSAPASGVGPIVIRKSGPASEVGPIQAPSAGPAGKVEPEAASSSGAATYTAVAVLGALVLTPFAWWYRRRQPSSSV